MLLPTDPSHSHNHALMVGREPELSRLRKLLSDAGDGQPSFVLLGGEAGIGKTRVIETLARESRAKGFVVLTGHCYDLNATLPYGPWVEALRSSMQPCATPLSLHPTSDLTKARDQVELFDGVWSGLVEQATSNPTVLVLEDLHWTDQASLDLLLFAGRNASTSLMPLRLLVIVTYRDNELSRHHPLFQMLPALVREARAKRINLRSFEPQSVTALIRAQHSLSIGDEARLANYLLTRSDGNPLFISELLWSLEDEQLLYWRDSRSQLADLSHPQIPSLIRQVIGNRVDRLSTTSQAALAVASVIGHEVTVGLWCLVSGLDEEQLSKIVDEAVETHVLEEVRDRTGYRFSHVLIRETVYESMTLPRRRAVHRRIAKALVGTSDASAGTVAYHFQQAGDEQAIEWHVRAGLHARRTAWITAAAHFEAAATLLEANESRERERGWLCFEAGFLLRFTGNTHSLDLLDIAATLAFKIDDSVLAAYACYARGAQRCMRGRIHDGILDLEHAVAAIDVLLEAQEIPASENHALTVIKTLLPESNTGFTRSEQLFASKRTSSVRLNQQRGVLLNWLGHSGRYREAVVIGDAYFDDAVAAFGDGHLGLPQCLSGRFGMGLTYAALGQANAARREFALSRTGFSIVGDFAMLEHSVWAELLTSLIPYGADRISDHMQLVDTAVEAWQRCRGLTITIAGDDVPCALQLDLLQGRWEQASRLAFHHLTAPWIVLVHDAILTLGTLARHQGDLGEAWERVRQLLPQGQATTQGNTFSPPELERLHLARNSRLTNTIFRLLGCGLRRTTTGCSGAVPDFGKQTTSSCGRGTMNFPATGRSPGSMPKQR